MNIPVNVKYLLFTLLSFSLVLLIFLNTCSQQSSPSVKVIAGKSIGQFKLNQEVEQSKIFEVLGKADSIDAAMCKSWNTWFLNKKLPRKEFNVYSVCDPNYDMKKSIKIIRLANAEFTTKKGITNKSTLKDLQEHLSGKVTIEDLENPTLDHVTLVDFESAGIAFEVMNNTITAVIVHEAGEKLTNTYLPFYKQK